MKTSYRPSRWTIIFLIITMPILTVAVLATTEIMGPNINPYFFCGKEKLCTMKDGFPFVETFAHGIDTKKARDIDWSFVADDSHVYSYPEWCGSDVATGFDAKTLNLVRLPDDSEITLSGEKLNRSRYLQDKNGTYISDKNGTYGRPKSERWWGCRFAKIDLTEQLKNMKK